MPEGYELTTDDRTAFALIAEAEQQYSEYLRIAQVGAYPSDLAGDDWAPSVPVIAPLSLAFRVRE